MAKQNSINDSVEQLTVDPGASGDSFIQFDINTTGEFRIGVDDDASDAFKISQGSALGTNDTFIMTAAGECTMPLQPGFLATINAEANATGDGTFHSVGSIAATTEIFDQNSDFTVGDGAGTGATFTAPVTGQYFLSMTLVIDIDATGGDEFFMQLNTSNRTYNAGQMPTENRVANFFGDSNYLGFTISALADMDASDTCTFRWVCNDGAKTDDLVEGTLSGYLAV